MSPNASTVATQNVTVKITPNDKGTPPGKLADAEIRFVDGVFAGLKLIGFAIWERRTGAGRNVTFPARQYSVNGERRSFALLRPVAEREAPVHASCRQPCGRKAGPGLRKRWPLRRLDQALEC